MIVSLKELAPVVSFVSSFADSKDPSSPFSFLWFAGGNARAFSPSAGTVWGCPAGVGDFAVQAAGFAHLVGSLAGQYSEVDLRTTEARLVVKAGGFRAQLPVWPPEVASPREWFERSVPEGGTVVDASFWEDVGRVKGSASSDAGKPFLCGVYWAADGTTVSSDNLRITVCRPRPGSVGLGVLIPAHLLKLVGLAPGFNRAVVKDGSVWFATEGGAVYGQMVSAEFPEKQMLGLVDKTRAEAAGGSRVEVGAPILQALDRLLYFSGLDTWSVQVAAAEGSVTVSVPENDGDGRSAEEALPAKVEGQAVEFLVNGKLFREGLEISTTFWYKPGGLLYFSNPATRLEQVLTTLAA